jgi:EAL and modified HD-GYP domain-containing signal transduction protein
MSAVRARACEIIARHRGDDELAGEAFLAGMLSLLDAMLGQPMPALLRELPVSDAIRLTLCGEAHTLRAILDAVIGYERGSWESIDRLAAQARIDARQLPGAFLEAMRWARELDAPATAVGRAS